MSPIPPSNPYRGPISTLKMLGGPPTHHGPYLDPIAALLYATGKPLHTVQFSNNPKREADLFLCGQVGLSSPRGHVPVLEPVHLTDNDNFTPMVALWLELEGPSSTLVAYGSDKNSPLLHLKTMANSVAAAAVVMPLNGHFTISLHNNTCDARWFFIQTMP